MIIVGIDEVGRGCWAGPLVAGAVILKTPVLGLRDSKKLSEKRRMVLEAQIKETAWFGLGWVWPNEVDTLGLTKSVALAMRRALAELSQPYDRIIIDGNFNFLSDINNTQAIIKADDSLPAVSAASILAKVARDTYMQQIVAIDYPEYGFEKHVGYGTLMHQHALKQYGVTPVHRLSYRPIREITT